MDVSIVMPVFNERAALRESLDRVLATGIPGEIIIVDDGSDGTSDVPRTSNGAISMPVP